MSETPGSPEEERPLVERLEEIIKNREGYSFMRDAQGPLLEVILATEELTMEESYELAKLFLRNYPVAGESPLNTILDQLNISHDEIKTAAEELGITILKDKVPDILSDNDEYLQALIRATDRVLTQNRRNGISHPFGINNLLREALWTKQRFLYSEDGQREKIPTLKAIFRLGTPTNPSTNIRRKFATMLIKTLLTQGNYGPSIKAQLEITTYEKLVESAKDLGVGGENLPTEDGTFPQDQSEDATLQFLIMVIEDFLIGQNSTTDNQTADIVHSRQLSREEHAIQRAIGDGQTEVNIEGRQIHTLEAIYTIPGLNTSKRNSLAVAFIQTQRNRYKYSYSEIIGALLTDKDKRQQWNDILENFPSPPDDHDSREPPEHVLEGISTLIRKNTTESLSTLGQALKTFIKDRRFQLPESLLTLYLPHTILGERALLDVIIHYAPEAEIAVEPATTRETALKRTEILARACIEEMRKAAKNPEEAVDFLESQLFFLEDALEATGNTDGATLIQNLRTDLLLPTSPTDPQETPTEPIDIPGTQTQELQFPHLVTRRRILQVIGGTIAFATATALLIPEISRLPPRLATTKTRETAKPDIQAPAPAPKADTTAIPTPDTQQPTDSTRVEIAPQPPDTSVPDTPQPDIAPDATPETTPEVAPEEPPPPLPVVIYQSILTGKVKVHIPKTKKALKEQETDWEFIGSKQGFAIFQRKDGKRAGTDTTNLKERFNRRLGEFPMQTEWLK